MRINVHIPAVVFLAVFSEDTPFPSAAFVILKPAVLLEVIPKIIKDEISYKIMIQILSIFAD